MGAALVTGGSGFVGSWLVRALQEHGEDVRVLDLVDDPGRHPDVEFIAGDVRDPMTCARACERVHVVYHAAGAVPLTRSRSVLWSVNRDGTRVLLAAARSRSVRKLVFLSSSAVYGIPAANPVLEDTEPGPIEEYGRAKLAAEEAVHDAVTEGLDATIVRPRTVVGAGRLGIFALLFEAVRRGNDVFVFGTGANRYQFIHPADVADACIRAARRPGASLYNVGAERFGTMRETLEGLIAHAGTSSRVRSVPSLFSVLLDLAWSVRLAPIAPYALRLYGRELYFDVSKAKNELGWSSRYGNQEMLCEAYDWYLKHGDAASSSPHRRGVRSGVLSLLKWLP